MITTAFTNLPDELRLMILKSIASEKDDSINRSIDAGKAFRSELNQAHDTYHLSNTTPTVEPLIKQYQSALGDAKRDAGQLLDIYGEPHPADQAYLAEKLEKSVEFAKNLRQTIFPGPSVTVREEPKSISMPLSRKKEQITDKDPVESHINGIGTEKEKAIYKHLHDQIKDRIRSVVRNENSSDTEETAAFRTWQDQRYLDKPKNEIASERQDFLKTLWTASNKQNNHNIQAESSST